MDQRYDVWIFCGFYALALTWFAFTFVVLFPTPLWYLGVSLGALGGLGNIFIDPLARFGYHWCPGWMSWGSSTSLSYADWRLYTHRVPAVAFVALCPAMIVADLFFV
jgi:hypothetical protein